MRIPERLDSQGRASCWVMWVRKEELWCCVEYHGFKQDGGGASMIQNYQAMRNKGQVEGMVHTVWI